MSVNLLIVDDHHIVVDGLKALLTGSDGIHITGEARNGAEALEMLRTLKIDLVLLDLDMPVMSGQELLKIMHHEMPEVKVIILTMHDEKGMIKSLIEQGAQGYLLKNSSRQELLDAIKGVMSGQQYLSSEVHSVLLTPDKDLRKGKLAQLTEREIEILKCITEGLSNKEIGERLFISPRTVDTHRTNMMQKLELHNVAGMVRFAIQSGLLD